MLFLGRTQTRARAWSCAPSPAAGRSDGGCWKEGRTGHNGACPARRLGSPVRRGGHPWEPELAIGRQGGGWQSGAAGEMPTARLVPAIGPKDDGKGKPVTDNRPAEVAMGRRNSSTAGPDCTAARHTDARSLAVPVPRGTMIPTTAAGRRCTPAVVSIVNPDSRGEVRLREPTEKVYAVGNRPRIFFHGWLNDARPVPSPGETCRRRSCGRNRWTRAEAAGRSHGRDDNGGCRSGAGGRVGQEQFADGWCGGRDDSFPGGSAATRAVGRR